MEPPPTGTTTFLFTDIEGSSRLWESHPSEMSSALAAHDAILAAAIDHHGGYVFSRGGDAFAAAFSRATGAVAAALQVRRELASHDWGVAEIRVRMGLHTGEAEERDGDYFGQDLNRTARLMAAGHGGQILVSGATADLVRNRLPDGVELVDRGAHQLKDVRDRVRIFELVGTDAGGELPPLRTASMRFGNLPVGLTNLIGRSKPAADVAELLESNRLVTLTGPGGVGKTRLATDVARRVSSRFGDGVCFVALADITDDALVPKQIALALGVQEQADRAVMETVTRELADREVLVVLDNCEHLVDAAARSARALMEACSRVWVLATSRERLGIAGETVWAVPALPLPADPADPLASAAVRLFVERARAVDAEFDPDDEELAACVDICRRVDGLPLAIELAAARVGVLSVSEIAERLSQRIDLLARTGRSDEGRQDTMRATIAWSHDLLPEAEKAAFRRLAVFRGGFTLDAVAAIAVDDAETAIDVLGRLVDQSLVVSERTARSRRFSLLETVRAFATEQLDGAGETNRTEDVHRDFFTGWARTQAKQLATADQLDALDALEADHDNLRAVLRRSIEGGNVERAVLLAADLSFFWWLHSHFAESQAWCDRLMAGSEDVSPRSRAKFLIGAGQMAMAIGDYDVARERLEEARRLAVESGSGRIAAWALANAATNETYQLHLDEARALGRDALSGFEASGDLAGAGYVAYMGVAVDFAARFGSGGLAPGDTADLVDRLEPAHAAAEMVGERNLLGHTSELLGSIALLAGEPGRGGEHLAQAVSALDAIGNQSCLAHAIERVALYGVQTGVARDSVVLLGAADAIRRGVGVGARVAEAEISRRVIDACKAALSDEDFASAWSAGEALDRPAAVASATDLAQGSTRRHSRHSP